ncbi:MAG: S8 family serine peptidase [Saprospiraceae bacterium]
MKTILLSLVLLFVASTGSLLAQDYAPNRLVAKFKSQPELIGFPDGSLSATCLLEDEQLSDIFIKEHLFAFKKTTKENDNGPFQNIYILRFEGNEDVLQKVDLLQKTGLFEYVEPDYIGTAGGVQMEQSLPLLLPNDQFFSRQWNMVNDGTFTLSTAKVDADIDMDEAWNIQQGSNAVTLAILDSGLKMDHPEMSGRLWTNPGEIAGNGIDDDNNGFIDDVNGWDFVNTDADPTDDQGHGSNVTGIAAATGNNGIGYAGVDWNCKVMVLKILDSNNSGFLSKWAEAVTYATDNGAHVMNMSVGGSGASTPLKTATDYAYVNNANIAACMMNFNNVTTYYPAGFDHTIAVGSTNPDDTRTEPFFWSGTSGSNYGAHIDVTGPGNYIYGLSNTSNTNYNSYWGGTSQATPLVAGLASLVLAQNPSLNPDDIRQLIEAGAEDQVGDNTDTPGFDIYYGHGRINAFNTLSLLTSTRDVKISENSLIIAPNPVRKGENISFEIPDSFDSGDLTLKDLKGRAVKVQRINQGDFIRIPIPQNIAGGVYFLELKDHKSYLSGKILVY